MMRQIAYFLISTLGLTADCALGQRIELVALDATWNYLDDGSDQGTAWREPGFDDSSWQSGPGPLGFGEQDLATLITRHPTGVTYYFRTLFEISAEDLARTAALEISLRRDDAAVVYLNGVELRRDNLPPGEIDSTTAANATVAGADETRFFTTLHSSGVLVSGTNTLAVEVHNSTPASSDLTLGLVLTADDDPGPHGGSRPPCRIDFETVEFPVASGMGVRRSIDPSYTGLEYSHNDRSTVGGGGVFRSSTEFFSGSSLGSTALAAINSDLRLESLPIDLSNYRDVQVALQLRTAGGLSLPQSQLAATVNVFSGINGSQALPWFSYGPKPGSDIVLSPSLFAERATVRYLVPTDSQLPIAEWVAADFDDSGWPTSPLGIGYERSSSNTYDPFLGTDLETQLYNRNGSVNIRVPFELSEAEIADAQYLIFDIRYDDGFVAFVNGTEIARKNAPALLTWNALATTTHGDADAVIYERIPLDQGPEILRAGGNVLAIQGLNTPAASSDMLIQPQLFLGKDAEPGGQPQLGDFEGQFHTLLSDPGLIPDSAISMTIAVDGVMQAGEDSAYYIDNIEVTGEPIAPDSFPTALALAGIEDIETNPDPDSDSLALLLEYAFGGEFLQLDDSQALLPQVAYDGLGFMTVQFRMLAGLTLGDAERGYDVADLRYTPQLSYDLSNWQDGSGVPPFEQIGDIVENGDGTVTVILRSRRRLQAERGRAFFRLLVEVARPPGVVLLGGG